MWVQHCQKSIKIFEKAKSLKTYEFQKNCTNIGTKGKNYRGAKTLSAHFCQWCVVAKDKKFRRLNTLSNTYNDKNY